MTSNQLSKNKRFSNISKWIFFFFIFNTIFSILIACRYIPYSQTINSIDGILFSILMYFAHFSTFNILILLPVFLLAAIVPHKKTIMTVAIILTTASSSLLLIDTFIYKLYRFHLNGGVFNLLFGGAASETFIFPAQMYYEALLMIFGILMFQIIAFYVANIITTKNPEIKVIAPVLILCTLVISVYHITHAWADAASYRPVLEHTELLPGSHGLTARRFLRKVGVHTNTEFEPDNFNNSSEDLHYPLKKVNCSNNEIPPNFIFIVIDSWRFDALNKVVTPNMYNFSKKGVRFKDHHSGGNATRIGMFSLFYSIPGTYWHRVLNEQVEPVFVEKLRESNIDIEIFRSAPLYSPEFDRTIFAEVENPRMKSKGNSPAEWDYDLTEDFKKYLKQRSDSNPFFALLFYDSPHSFDYPKDFDAPFKPSLDEVNYFKLDPDTDPVPFKNRYLNSVYYVDTLVGDVLDSLKESRLLDSSVIVITSDHGQQFNDNGLNYWGHNSNYTFHQTKVPFVIYDPRKQPETIEHKTSHFDVAPTFMKTYLGCSTDFKFYSTGHDLFDSKERKSLIMSGYNDFAIVDQNQITTVDTFGYKFYGHKYKIKRDASIDQKSLISAFEQMSRFYKPLNQQ